MVMDSTWMLQQALPLPGRFLLPKFSLESATTYYLRRANPHKKIQAFGQGASVRALGVGCSVFSFVNNLRVVVPGVRTLSCAASSSFNSAMAGACSDNLPPMYRANVGVCLINEKNQPGHIYINEERCVCWPMNETKKSFHVTFWDPLNLQELRGCNIIRSLAEGHMNLNNWVAVFVAQRLDIPGAWQMPQGGVDGEEDPRAAAFRELREETGVTSAEYLGEWLTYDFPPEVKAKLTKLWGTEWNGQAQKWFLFKFTGNETEINLLGDGSEKPEFSEWKWVPVEEVINNAVEFKKQVYERAFKHLLKLMK